MQVVAGVRHLARVADVVPGVGEEVLLLEREQLLAQVEVAVHAVVLDQRGDLVRRTRLRSAHSVRLPTLLPPQT